jgi:hypothetical protein
MNKFILWWLHADFPQVIKTYDGKLEDLCENFALRYCLS